MASIYPYKGGWRAQVRPAGQQGTSRTFRTRKEALAWARSLEHQADLGRRVAGSTARVGWLLEQYRAARADAGRPVARQSTEHYMLAGLAAWFAALRLDRLSTASLVDYARARRRAGAGPYTVNMEISKLGTALRYVASLLGVPYADQVGVARPTLRHFKLIGAGRKRERRPSEDEWVALLAALAALPTTIPMVDIVRLGALNAFRRGEVCRISWTDLDVAARTIVVRDRKDPRAKAGNDQVVPLVGESLDIIMRQPRPAEGATDQRIFPYQPGTVSRCFKVAARAAGIADLRLHDMRHEATSALFERGYPIEEVSAVTGIKDWRNLRRYTQVNPARVAKRGR